MTLTTRILNEWKFFLAYTLGIATVVGVITSGCFYWSIEPGLIAAATGLVWGLIGFFVVHLPLVRKEEKFND